MVVKVPYHELSHLLSQMTGYSFDIRMVRTDVVEIHLDLGFFCGLGLPGLLVEQLLSLDLSFEAYTNNVLAAQCHNPVKIRILKRLLPRIRESMPFISIKGDVILISLKDMPQIAGIMSKLALSNVSVSASEVELSIQINN